MVLIGGLAACADTKHDPDAALDEMVAEINERFDQVSHLSTEALQAWLDDPDRPDPVLLDAREPGEFAVSHLPGAIRVDPEATAGEVREKVKDGASVVVYCSVGYRSSELAKRLTDAGFRDVQNLEGSIFKWANEGRPLMRANQPAETVHPYNRRYAKMLRENLRAEE